MIVKRIGYIGAALCLLLATLAVGFADIGTAGAATLAATATTGTTLKGPNFRVWGRYTESAADMQVKVIGGDIMVWRTWADGVWQIDRAWNPLSTSADDASVFDPAVLTSGTATTTNPSIYRNYREFTYVSAGQYAYQNLSIIRVTSTGYRWQDHQGNWIDYDQQGRAVAYGGPNNVTNTLMHDTQGRIIGVKDVNGKQVLWCDYDATTGYLIDVHDYTGRKVQYAYTTFTPPAGADPSWKAHPLLTQVTDVRGKIWKYTYDSVGRLASETNPLGRTVSFTYSAQDRLLKKVDQDGVGIAYSYNYDKTTGQFYQKETTAGGVVTETWTDSKGDVVHVDIGGNTIYKMADNGRTAIRTDSAGNNTNQTYDEWGNLLTATYADGSSIKYTYDSKYSNVLSYTDENGVTTTYSYDANGNLLSKTEAVGTPVQRTTSYKYDQYGQVLTITRGASSYTYTYDAYGNVASVTGPLGNKASYTFDVMGNELTKTDALGKVWTSTFDAAGNLMTKRDPLGDTITYTYDGMGNRLSKTDARGNTITYAYDIRGQRTSAADALGGTLSMTYSKDGRLIKRTDASGVMESYAYDTAGRLDRITDGDGNTIGLTFSSTKFIATGVNFPTLTRKLSYDSRGRMISSTDVLNSTTSLTAKVAYDGAGNKVSITGPTGRVTKYTYDALDRLSTVTDPSGGVTTYTYDAFDDLLSVTDANGNAAFRYQYDAAGRKVKELRPMGQATTYSYDGEDNVTSSTDANGQTITYSYDGEGRPVAIHYPATNGFAAKTVGFTYDADGNLTGYTDGTTSGSYTYDADNRKLTDSVNYGAFTLSSSCTYYANGQKKSFIGPDGKQIDYSYDAGGQLQSVSIPGQGSIVYNSYDWLVPTKVTLPGGSTKNYTYDALMRPIDINMKDPASNTLMHYQYSYDAVGNIKTKNTEHGIYSFGYDNLDRLTSASYPNKASESFGYDKVGNRALHNTNPWAYNANNELLSRPNVSYTYDANGSQIQKTDNGITTDYVYNAQSRLAQVKQGSSLIAQYYYDPFGQRLSKTVNGTTIYFYYGDEGLVTEADSTGKVLVSYGYGPGSNWGTDPLYMNVNGGYYYYLNDVIGTPQKLISQNGAKAWEATYDAFGKATVSAGSTVTNNLRFPGQYYDEETKINYNYIRYYNDIIGRYASSDPSGLSGGMNAYVYALSNPLSVFDSTGLRWLTQIGSGKIRKLVKERISHFNEFHQGSKFHPDVDIIVCLINLESSRIPGIRPPGKDSTASGLMQVTNGTATEPQIARILHGWAPGPIEPVDWDRIHNPKTMADAGYGIDVGISILDLKTQYSHAHGNPWWGLYYYHGRKAKAGKTTPTQAEQENMAYAQAITNCAHCMRKAYGERDGHDTICGHIGNVGNCEKLAHSHHPFADYLDSQQGYSNYSNNHPAPSHLF